MARFKGNTGNIGAEGEMLVTLDLMRTGWEVFRAVSPTATVDLIAMRDGLVSRIEVTKGTRKGSTHWLKWSPHDAARFDVLAVWESDGRITYIPSKDTLKHRT